MVPWFYYSSRLLCTFMHKRTHNGDINSSSTYVPIVIHIFLVKFQVCVTLVSHAQRLQVHPPHLYLLFQGIRQSTLLPGQIWLHNCQPTEKPSHNWTLSKSLVSFLAHFKITDCNYWNNTFDHKESNNTRSWLVDYDSNEPSIEIPCIQPSKSQPVIKIASLFLISDCMI